MMGERRIIKLTGHMQREYAATLIRTAPDNYVCTIQEPTRSLDANAKLWCLLGDVSKAEPMGRKHTTEEWKCIFCHACGWEVQFTPGLDGRPFPVGFRTSRMSIREMSDLIEFITAWMAEQGIPSSEPNPYQ